LVIATGLLGASADAAVDPIYREFTQRVRSSGVFEIPMASGGNQKFEYQFAQGAPRTSEPTTTDIYLDTTGDLFVRRFFDKIYLKDGSSIVLNGERIPLTCVVIDGRDNRFSGKDSVLIPDFVLRVYLVANDYTCTGPINPQWPQSSGRRETWETYLYFEVRDPTIMLPAEIKLRYRWNEFPAIVSDAGGAF